MAVEVHGTCDEKFASVRDLLAKNIEDGQDVGSSFALTINGESVIDIWAGHQDERVSKNGRKTPSLTCTARPRPCRSYAHWYWLIVANLILTRTLHGTGQSSLRTERKKLRCGT